MNKRIRKKNMKNMKYPKEVIKSAVRFNTHLRLYPILGDLPNDYMARLNMIRSLRRASSYTWQHEKHHPSIKIQMSSEYGVPQGLDPYNVLFTRPITMLELFLKERKLCKEKIINLKRTHRNYTEDLKI